MKPYTFSGNCKQLNVARALIAAILLGSATVQAVTFPLNTDTTRAAFAPFISASVGKSILMRLPERATRISVGNKAVADVILLNPKELYLLGKSVGSTNVIIWARDGNSTAMDVQVGIDTSPLLDRLHQLMPGEKGIKVSMAADSLVLSGTVENAIDVDKAMTLAEAYAGKKVLNMLATAAPQQVMLEVKVAEISKTLLDSLGVNFNLTHAATLNGAGWQLLSGFLTNSSGVVSANKSGGTSRSVTADAENDSGLVKILAEPTIMAISGQEGTFLSGGKIFIPVPQTGVAGSFGITLEEREFGVGLRVTPTVLADGRINLRVMPEVSQLSTTGTTVTSGGATIVLPTITTRRASTTVELYDGQSFAIGGLISNNVTETIKAFPWLGEIPILGPLFRSSQFQKDKTELVFVVTPHLVKPLPPNYKLPTDNFIEPTPKEFFLKGKMEGDPPSSKPAAPNPAAPNPPGSSPSQGFEMK